MNLLRLAIHFGISSLLLVACSSKTSTTSGGPACEQGSEGCDCYGNNTCDTGLTCLSKICVDPSDGSGGSSGAEGGSTKGGTSSSKGGSTSKSSSNGGTTSSTGGTTNTGGTTSAGGTTTAPGDSGGSTSVGGSTSSGGSTSGGATTNVGGSTGSGVTTTVGGTTSITTSTVVGYHVYAGGYVTLGHGAQGYAWTEAVSGTSSGAVATTISPASFATLADGAALSATGTVGRDAVYSGVAMLGINLNQASAAGSPVGNWTPSGTGIAFNVTNTGGSDVRITIRDSSGTAAGRWCFSISGKTTGTIQWADFNTTCWIPATGKAYNGTTPLRDITLIVPGRDLSEAPFNFTVNSLSITP